MFDRIQYLHLNSYIESHLDLQETTWSQSELMLAITGLSLPEDMWSQDLMQHWTQ